MSIIIRPSTGVFGRTLPLVLAFGAYRAPGAPPLDEIDRNTIVSAVSFARNIRAPLAILRELCSEPGGAWLDGCRPRVTDRVFDHPNGSAFQNVEFLNVFTRITEREVVAIGPRNDSSMRATLIDPAAGTRSIRGIIPDHPLQNCSTGAADAPLVLRTSTTFGGARDIPLSRWRRSMVELENWGAVADGLLGNG